MTAEMHDLPQRGLLTFFQKKSIILIGFLVAAFRLQKGAERRDIDVSLHNVTKVR